ncbi:hypothetical protein Bca52824_076457 [Brassica carinata]|uniref:AP2/ERF domain-containing protein n=1 Tax=Brassica carinata TaxID=52824 RepID=A0A8X7PV51_BRACI|nr:hypothetical protein Bca52824_076457 [Brassica carinata]
MDQGPSSSKYKGVRKRKWGSGFRRSDFPTESVSGWDLTTLPRRRRAFDAALYCLRGSGTKFNFPDNPPAISGGGTYRDRRSRRREGSLIRKRVWRVRWWCSSKSLLRRRWRLIREFLSMLPTVGSGNFASDFGLFPGFDDFADEFLGDRFVEQVSPTWNGDESCYDGSVSLWNF